MKMTISKKLFIAAATITVIFIAFAVVFQLHVSSFALEIESLKTQISENEDTANVVSIKRNIDNVSRYSDILRAYSIEEESAIAFIESLERLGAENDVVLLVQKVDMTDKTSKLKEFKEDGTESISDVRSHGELNLVFTAEANWTSLMEFLILLQNVPYNTAITDLKITSKSGVGANGSPLWLATLQIVGITN